MDKFQEAYLKLLYEDVEAETEDEVTEQEPEQKYVYNEAEFEQAWKKYTSDKSETKWVRRRWPLKELKEVFREICKNVSKGNDLGAFKAWQKIATDGCLFRFAWKLGWNPGVPRSFADNAPKFIRFKKKSKKK